MKREPTKPNIVNEVHRERLCYLGIFLWKEICWAVPVYDWNCLR